MKIYSKLPHGLTFTVGEHKVTINGSNTPGCVIPGHGVTGISDDIWKELVRLYGSHKALKNEHIFVAKSEGDAESIAEEREKEKTGLEQLDPKALKGVETSDDKTADIAAISKKAEGK